ncbi:Clp protease ClpP [Listeria monocytogenes]|uniref:ATP-dependent Clp protease proteolytic subunit n=1 Tax=Listeria monocytogenes TaxID=1639 RepID=A0AAN2ZU09_LISMN|nr:Clp protease ClpP [Listeria monocytogenes]EAG8858265.1 Clp protease ClpP [Listeria monocytogenes]EAG8954073.1 Clp protease ClpP [Listeria monocytogenes]EAH0425549.1 Clp protease ClpP [Listeria monocytogenes]EAH0659507.1 Clp protease ClpP [Listeria monocytogenes]
MKLEIKGTIISNNQKWIYDMLDMESTSPRDIVLPENNESIDVIINSGGGDVYAGSEIYTTLKGYNGTVNVKVVGIAASAASVIAMAGDKVEISPTAQIMVHNVASGVFGDYRDLEHEAKVSKGFNVSVANAYMDKTGKNMDELLNLMGETTWFNAQQAVEAGFADEVMFSNEKAPQLVANLSPVIPQDAIEKIINNIKPPQLDIDAIVGKVINQLEQSNDKEEKPKKENIHPFKRFLF